LLTHVLYLMMTGEMTALFAASGDRWVKPCMELPGPSMITLLCRSTVRLFCCLFGYIDPASAQRFLYHLSVVPICTAGHRLCVVVVDSGAHTFVSRWPCDALRSRRGCSV
jgi:hypothetical protein